MHHQTPNAGCLLRAGYKGGRRVTLIALRSRLCSDAELWTLSLFWYFWTHLMLGLNQAPYMLRTLPLSCTPALRVCLSNQTQHYSQPRMCWHWAQQPSTAALGLFLDRAACQECLTCRPWPSAYSTHPSRSGSISQLPPQPMPPLRVCPLPLTSEHPTACRVWYSVWYLSPLPKRSHVAHRLSYSFLLILNYLANSNTNEAIMHVIFSSLYSK